MVSSSKILTVSYGTFSCTAEGFDDPLEVVKEATHFFRGVVRDDRFFGAEPPQFDAEMAAGILQAQMAGAQGDGQLTLGKPHAASAGAMDAVLPAAPDADEPQDAPMPQAGIDSDNAQPEAPVHEDVTSEVLAALSGADPVMDDDIEQPGNAPVAPTATLTDPETVSAKLQRIRAVVARCQAPAPQADDAEIDADTQFAETARDSAEEYDAAFDEADVFADEDLDEEELFAEDLAEDALDYDAPDYDDEEADHLNGDDTDHVPDAASVAARVVKVRRTAFEAPAAQGPEHDDISSLSPEDEDDLARELEAVRAELQAGFAQGWDEDDEADESHDAPAAHAEAAPQRRAEAEDDWLLGTDWDDEGEGDEDGAQDARRDPALRAAAMLRQQAQDPVAEPMDASEPELEAAEEPTAIDDESENEDERALSVTTHLARMAQEEVRKAIKMSSPARAMLTEQSVEDNDASRILDETNSQMREPEGNRRRSAIAHLRAAVAATRADRRLGRRKDADKASEPYREDLADVVRPRRPEAPAIHTDRPVDQSRAAPLKLVAEQRVDAERSPTRPRRVRVADIDEDTGAADSGFADYAASVGARDLPELLEAAAAYMSFVERREQFSRPQLMTKVRQAEQSESSREDRLRTFGQLLREGKIEKTRGGRFTASDRISFKPDARAAG